MVKKMLRKEDLPDLRDSETHREQTLSARNKTECYFANEIERRLRVHQSR